MKSVLFSINKPHTDHIRYGIKKLELRTKPPKIEGVYKGLIYETKKNGGCGKVIGEFTAYNENTYRVCMGVPKHLALESCLSTADILRYSDNGKKDITAISISDLVIYDEPKDLSEFHKGGMLSYDDWLYGIYNGHGGATSRYESYKNVFALTRPPQSWEYVEEL